MFSNFSLRAKLYLQYGLVLIPIFLVLAYFLHENHQRVTDIVNRFGHYNALVDAERDYKHFIDAATDALDTGKLGQSGLQALQRARELLAQSELNSGEEKQLIDKLEALGLSLKTDSSIENLAKQREFIHQAKTRIAGMAESQSKEIDAHFNRELRRTKESIFYTQLFTVLMAIAAFFLARALTNSLHRPLQIAMATADRIAQGNLNNPPVAESKTELGKLARSLNGMNARLRELLGEIMGTSQQVNKASDEILQNNSTLMQRAEAEATTLEQTSASLEQLTATVSRNSERSQAALALAQEAVANGESSSDVVRQMVDTMANIRDSSQRVSEIIALIDGIAFQTNILALNAAVEAARAGEQGAGFAVVAAEVRNLAQRCAAAAKDIKTLIKESAQKIGSGTDLAVVAGSAMESTVESIEKVSSLLNEIAIASTEQREGIAQINQAMLLLDRATQQSGAVVDQAGGIAIRLSQHAQTLNTLVRQFDLGHQPQVLHSTAPTPQRAIREPYPASLLRNRNAVQTGHSDAGDWTEF